MNNGRLTVVGGGCSCKERCNHEFIMKSGNNERRQEILQKRGRGKRRIRIPTRIVYCRL